MSKWCLECNKEIYENVCDICGKPGQEDIPSEVRWCDHCNTPVVKNTNANLSSKCPICGSELRYLCRDLRPVFPEERYLIEILLGKDFKWKDKAVWANDNRYYVDGKSVPVSLNKYINLDITDIKNKLKGQNIESEYEVFNQNIIRFIKANKERLSTITNEAYRFISKESQSYSEEQLVISFSGGKDSTVVADLVVKALSKPQLVHIFGDTTLEFPLTHEYVTRFRADNPKAILKTAKNKDQDFYKVCEDIGPPARMMRWCCTMFKTGPITRVLNALYREEKILTFYGIRKNESLSRSKYKRIEKESEQVKIQKQAVASPIFFWSDLEIWLYLLSGNVDFNDAYRLGYDRVGCWCCPNNSMRAQLLAKIYMPEESTKWRNYLIGFAKSIGKPDPEEYIDGGWWKARQGGNGMPSADDVIIKFTNCTTEDNAKIYNLNKPIDDSFYNLFTPFGKVPKNNRTEILKEEFVYDMKTDVPIISIQSFSQPGYDYSVKMKTLNVSAHSDLQRMIGYQVKKFNACRRCLKCESICTNNAISVNKSQYFINEKKCSRCKKCVKPKYLDGGCLMDKFLKTKKDK